MSGLSHHKRKLAHIGLLMLLSCFSFHCDSESDLSFSESGGTYNHDIFVDISLDSDSALSCSESSDDSTIYYTTDGSEPDPYSSSVYNGPIQISGDGTSMTIVAATFDSDGNIDQYNYESYYIDYSYTGNGGTGDSSIDGTGSSAKFSTPGMITYDGAGNLYVADKINGSIRRVNTTTGVVKTVAGSPSNYGSHDGTGTGASFNIPEGIVYYNSTLYVSENLFVDHIRQISVPEFSVTTIAGGINGFQDGSPSSSQFDMPIGLSYTGGKLYIADRGNNRIRAYTASSVTTVTTSVSSPIGITTDDTNLYVTDSHEIHKIVISTGVISNIAGDSSIGSSDGIGTSAGFDNPSGIAYANGHLYVADTGNHAIRDIEISSRSVTLFAGSISEAGTANGIGTAARFNSPYGICTTAHICM
jgi:hypothetical protein